MRSREIFGTKPSSDDSLCIGPMVLHESGGKGLGSEVKGGLCVIGVESEVGSQKSGEEIGKTFYTRLRRLARDQMVRH